MFNEEHKQKAVETRKKNFLERQSRRFKTLREAVDAHCKGCIYDPLSGGTWRDQVENCTVKSCELYEYRPRKNLILILTRN